MNKRPLFHFTPIKNWMNDPNGLCYYKGKYHLFYQHNPENLYWGNMTWGHATSDDLFNWEHLPYAISPDIPEDIDGCFSGSGFVKDDELYLAYTGVIMTTKKINEYGNTVTVGENDLISTQLFAKSKDGFTFEKLSEPKIVAPEGYCTAHFRDPKIWEKNGKYYMVLGGKKDNKGRVLFYQSEDFKNWKFVNEIYEENMGFMWECPDFFELDGKSILVFSPQGIGKEGQEHLAGYYMGDFDYETGKLTHKEFQVLDNGFELYAPQTFKDNKGRRIMIAWLVNHHPFPEEDWTGMMTLPRELKIIDDKLYMYPVEEFNKYRKNLEIYKKMDTEFQIEVTDKIYDVEFKLNCDKNFEIIIGDKERKGLKLTYSSQDKRIIFDRSGAVNNFESLEIFGTKRVVNYTLSDDTDFRIIRDKNVVEIYINKGEKVFTSLVNFTEEQNFITIVGESNVVKVYSLKN